MTPVLAAAIYFICWWLVLFIVLPIGVRTQEEEGAVEPGTTESAPAKPFLLVKMIATTLLSALFLAGLYANWEYQLVTIDSIPFLPEFEPLAGAQQP